MTGRYRQNSGPIQAEPESPSSSFLSGISNAHDSSIYSPSTSCIHISVENLKSDPNPYDYHQFEAYDHEKYPYMKPIPMTLAQKDRINILEGRLDCLRRAFTQAKSRQHELERRKKRAFQRKKDRERKERKEELAKTSTAVDANSGSESSSSSSKNENERSSRLLRRDNGKSSSARSEETSPKSGDKSSDLISQDST